VTALFRDVSFFEDQMRSLKDIKLLLWFGYAIAYPLAVLPPIVIDPLLRSHVYYSSRQYPYAFLSIPIFALLLAAQYLWLRTAKSVKSLYASVGIFFLSTLMTLPLFQPEFPHGNVITVGVLASFFCSFSIFVWSIGRQISIYTEGLTSEGTGTVEYMTALSGFVRQGAFAAVALFGALFFGAFATLFGYVESVVTEKADLFLLKYNTAFQIGFYAMYSLVGPVRYFFMMNLYILSEFKKITATPKTIAKPRRPRK
jgi:hypothetical protein